MSPATDFSVAQALEIEMKKRTLMIASITAAAVLAAGSVLAQSSGVGDSAPPSVQGQGPRGTGPGMMQNMAHGMGPCMGPSMMQRMRSGMMQGGMMRGGFGLTQIDPAQVSTLKTELGITPAQETAWTKYSNVLSDAATTMKSTREAAKTAADELLTALDEGQKAKAREILPGLASSSHGMMSGMAMGDHR
jgi:hypothetical protein